MTNIISGALTKAPAAGQGSPPRARESLRGVELSISRGWKGSTELDPMMPATTPDGLSISARL
jgi:hypothetical protein